MADLTAIHPEVASVLAMVEEARDEVLATLQGVTQAQFVRRPPGEVTPEDERWPIRDVLWHVGLVEDWYRRSIDAALGGRAVEPYEAIRRPARLNTLPLLIEWLDQTRRPLRSLLGRIGPADLDREVAWAGGRTRTPRAALGRLAEHDRVHVEQVRDLLALPPEPEA